MFSLTWGAVTDAGRQRSRNEDAYFADDRLFVVADGMGGHAAGDVASQLAVTALAAAAEDDLTRDAILRAVDDANREIVRQGSDRPNGMGTTICGIGVLGPRADGQRLFAFNVGDSRAYRLTGGHLRQLTHDHSLVQSLLDSGSITEAEAEHHPDRNVITRSLGTGGMTSVDWWYVDADAGDRFLITSDGLVRELADDVVAAILSRDAPPQAIADDLVQHALAAGGRDNITVIVVHVDHADRPVGDTFDPLDADTNPRVRESDATTVPPILAPTNEV